MFVVREFYTNLGVILPPRTICPRDAQRAGSKRAVDEWKRLLKTDRSSWPSESAQRGENTSLQLSLCLPIPFVLLHHKCKS